VVIDIPDELIMIPMDAILIEQAFGNPLVENLFTEVFKAIDFPLLLILVGIIFTALIQSSSASTGVVITMVGAGVRTLCDFCKNQLCRFCEKFEIFDLLAKMRSSVASRARRYPLVRTCWETSQAL